MTYRVLHIIDTGGPGGAETVLKNIVQGLPGDEAESLCASDLVSTNLPRSRGSLPALVLLPAFRLEVFQSPGAVERYVWCR